MPNKKLTQLPVNTSPTSLDIFPVVNSGVTTQLSLGNLTKYLNNNFFTKHWLENKNITLLPDESLVINGNYVLSASTLTLTTNNFELSIGDLKFNKYSQIFIGGHLLIIDSTIINNGLISVTGAIIFSGNSNITGDGIIT